MDRSLGSTWVTKKERENGMLHLLLSIVRKLRQIISLGMKVKKLAVFHLPLMEERIFVLSIRCLGRAEYLTFELEVIFACDTVHHVQRRNLK